MRRIRWLNKLGKILVTYDNNIIEVEGHTDNVPIHSSKYEDNNVLSMYRALAVANYLRDTTTLDPAYIKSSGRGEYVPIADNATPEGRARNRRVEIKIYNSYNSNVSGTSTDDTGTETPADAGFKHGDGDRYAGSSDNRCDCGTDRSCERIGREA